MSKLELLLNFGKGVLVLSFFDSNDGNKLIINKFIKNLISDFSFFKYEPYHYLMSHLRQMCDQMIEQQPNKTLKCLNIKKSIQECTKNVLLLYLREKLGYLYSQKYNPIIQSMPSPPLFLWSSSHFRLSAHSWEEIIEMDEEYLDFQVSEMIRRRQKNISFFKDWEDAWKLIRKSKDLLPEDYSKIF